MENPSIDMTGKVCMVTGANSGIGKETVVGLAKMGATVVMVCRSRERGDVAMAEIKEESRNDSVDLMVADLSIQKEIRRLAQQFKDRYQRLDVLVNNAGINLAKRQESVDSIEMVFAVNYLAYFLLTDLLLETLKASAPARIVNVSSRAHRLWTNKINFDDLQGKQKFFGPQAYAQSKLAILMFTYELARRLEGTAVTVNALHPGVVKTNLGHGLTGILAIVKWVFRNVLAISPEKGALTSIYLATSPDVEGVTGKYFVKQKPKRSSKASYDRQAWQRLWQISEDLTRN